MSYYMEVVLSERSNLNVQPCSNSIPHKGKEFISYLSQKVMEANSIAQARQKSTARTEAFLEQGRFIFRIHSQSHHHTQEDREHVVSLLSRSIAEYIVERLEPCLIGKMIQAMGYTYSPILEEKSIRMHQVYPMDNGLCEVEAKLDGYLREGTNYRIGVLYNLIVAQLMSTQYIHLDGFLRFRLREYVQGLKQDVEHAIEEYVIEYEHQQFLRHLRHRFLQQEPMVPTIHVVHSQDHELVLYNQAGDSLQEEYTSGSSPVKPSATIPIRHEEVIIYNIIQLAPRQLILHTARTQSSIVKAIQYVFRTRVTLCSQCDRCEALVQSPT